MKNLHTMRTLTYKVTPERLMEIQRTQKFRDLVAVGKMLNAITYAHEYGVSFQLAKFGILRTSTSEIICLTGGLLYKALALSFGLLERYRNKYYVKDLNGLVLLNYDYNPPEVLVDMRSNGPFRIGTKPEAAHMLRELCLTGKTELFREMEVDDGGFQVARITDVDAWAEDIKRGNEPEVHLDMESVVDCLVDEFTLAAEEFIFGMSRELGLTNAAEPPAEEMKLAA